MISRSTTRARSSCRARASRSAPRTRIINDDCPKGSHVGTGTASAILGVNNPPEKARIPLTFKIKAFVTGAKGISFRLAANEIPTLVVVSPGKISSNGQQAQHPRARVRAVA